jgi:hypothetical protein
MDVLFLYFRIRDVSLFKYLSLVAFFGYAKKRREIEFDVCRTVRRNIYSKTNQMHNISNLFYFGNNTLHVSDGLSIIKTLLLRLYIQNRVFVIQVLWRLARTNT